MTCTCNPDPKTGECIHARHERALAVTVRLLQRRVEALERGVLRAEDDKRHGWAVRLNDMVRRVWR